MGRRKAQFLELGMGRPIGCKAVGLPGSFEVHCRTDYEGSVNLQECLAHVISQMDCSTKQLQQQPEQRSQLVPPFSQPFGNQKVRNGNAKKVLVLITVPGSAGPLRVILDANVSANEVIKQALERYSKEGRRPTLDLNGSHFELCYLQKPSEVLEPNVRIGNLIFFQFLLFHKKDISTDSPDGTGKKKMQSLDVEGSNSWWSNIMASMTSGLFMQTIGKSWQIHQICL